MTLSLLQRRMMNRRFFLSVSALLSISSLFGQQATPLSEDFLKASVVEISSIDPQRSEYQDLAFLSDELKGVEILLLGEQGHGNGSTFLAKTRLIKYLHEQHGFNVLAFESGLFDCYRVWEAIQNGADSLSVFSLGVFPVWVKSEQVQPLFQYILDQSKTNNPLILTGFDMQPTGVISPDKRFSVLQDYLDKLLGAEWHKNYATLAEVFKDTRKIFASPLSAADATKFEEEVKQLSRDIAEQDNSVKGKVMSRYILNYFDTIELFSKADLQNPSNTPHVMNIRDNRMAENFELIKEVIYPDEKIIAWGANTHFGYGRGLLGSFEGQEAPEQDMVPAGQYLKINYQSKLYSMAFTSYTGKSGSLNREAYKIPPAKPGSLEHQLNQMGVEYGFLSLRKPELKSKRFVTTFYGHSEMSGVWGQMADGVFFIRNMEASKFK